MEILGLSPDWITAWGAVATAGVALLAAIVAWFQVREAKQLRWEQAQPFVVVDIEPSPHEYQVLELVIANVGKTLARDVTFEFDPPLSRAFRKDNDPNDWAIIKHGVPAMPPGKSFRMWLDIGHQRVSAGLIDTKYSVTVHSHGPRGQRLDPLKFVIDLSIYREPNHMTVKTVHHVAKALQEISKTLGSDR